ncbi:MAG: HTH domain-containing protein [Bacteroides sp.]|nr:HTH domain-containing protein [Bacteroides sp.]
MPRKKIAERYKSICELIKQNPSISAQQLSVALSVSDRTIERDLAKLQEIGTLIREGSDNGGRWLITK